jgi:hypothetical protein
MSIKMIYLNVKMYGDEKEWGEWEGEDEIKHCSKRVQIKSLMTRTVQVQNCLFAVFSSHSIASCSEPFLKLNF